MEIMIKLEKNLALPDSKNQKTLIRKANVYSNSIFIGYFVL